MPHTLPTPPIAASARATSLTLILTLFLPLLMPALPLAAQTPSTQPAGAALTADQRILHVLNRFTFGPTPQDVATVQKLGVDKWFDLQLYPGNLPDPEVKARLAQFPSLELPVSELLYRFPSNGIIRQTENGKLPLPTDPWLAAVYRRHIALYQDKQQKKLAAKPDKSDKPQPVMAPVSISSSRSEPPARPSYTDLMVKSVLALPPDQRIAHIVAMQSGEYNEFRDALKGPQKSQLFQGLLPEQQEYLRSYENPSRTVVEELQSQKLLRDIYSSRQLQEVMTTFWLNHFNVYLHKNDEEPYYLVSYERDVIRPLALGNFEDLLIATAESPAMLLYLDNSQSTGPDSLAAEKQKQRAAKGKDTKATQSTPPGLNENYARELMELHTLGVNGGYAQKDVTEVAKVFTGWTVDKPQQGGGFKFDESRHQPGKKLVLGKKIKENGQKEGLQLLHMLATSPATAHFISQELAVTFVSDNPSPALVNRMAHTFLSSHGDIPSVLKTMLHAPEFWAPSAYQAKVKTPLEYVVSAARASGTEVTNPQPLINALNQMGMPLYACVPPTGYSAKSDEWVSTGALVTRMNFGLSLATNHYPDIRTNLGLSQPDLAEVTPADAEQRLEARLIPTGISDQTRSAVLTQATTPSKPMAPSTGPPTKPSTKPGDTQNAATAQQAAKTQQDAQLAGLLLGSPEFQRR